MTKIQDLVTAARRIGPVINAMALVHQRVRHVNKTIARNAYYALKTNMGFLVKTTVVINV